MARDISEKIQEAKDWCRENPDKTVADYRREVENPLQYRTFNKHVKGEPYTPQSTSRTRTQRRVYQTIAVVDEATTLQELIKTINDSCSTHLELVQLANNEMELRRTQGR